MSLQTNGLHEAREFLLGENYPEAFKRYSEIIKTSGPSSVVWVEYGFAASGLGKDRLARKAWGAAVKLQPDNGPLLLQVGHGYKAIRQVDAARRLFRRAADASPTDIDSRVSLALSFDRCHDYESARAALDECFAINAKDEQAMYISAIVARHDKCLDEAEATLRELIGMKPRNNYVSYACRYELAEILNQTNRFDEAMRSLKDAKRIASKFVNVKRSCETYDAIAGSRVKLAQSLPRDVLKHWSKGNAREAEVGRRALLCGHPRSGTTLLETILGAHPSVFTVDEPIIVDHLFDRQKEDLGSIDASRLRKMRSRYVKMLAEEIGKMSLKNEVPAARRFLLEKNPSLTPLLPAVLRLFPTLPLIVSLRDPRDVVLSCYFQNLSLNLASINGLSLERLAKYYASVMDVWLAVRKWDDLAWLETRYENVVENLESEGRRVMEFIGLKWHDKQARFSEDRSNKQLFAPTFHDVTQPIYRRAVSRWKNYEAYLEPILPTLEPYCRALGYEY